MDDSFQNKWYCVPLGEAAERDEDFGNMLPGPERPVHYLIEKLIAFDKTYPNALQKEFLDWLDIVVIGADKYECNNWLKADGAKSDRKANFDSMSHHLAEGWVGGPESIDKESKYHPYKHLACRAIMGYIRDLRGIRHPLDPVIKDNVPDLHMEDQYHRVKALRKPKLKGN